METGNHSSQSNCECDPYSLGILIEWKPDRDLFGFLSLLSSLLARDINWMETSVDRDFVRKNLTSLLARDIN